MVFDDHDVTDDWNLCQLWRERVVGNPLGRSVWRDGLAVFALFQGWGNDPAAYDTQPGADVLDVCGRLFPADGRAGPDPQAVTDLDHLFGLGAEPPVMRWNYTVDGSVHRVLACDTRTRRGFTGPVSPPIQLPDGERQAQIPEGPLPAGFEVLFVVLSQPAVDPVMLGELTQGLIANGVSALSNIRKKMDVQDRAIVGLETLDYEGWGARPLEIVGLLDRLSTYPRVIIMSGDVHFAVCLSLWFWRRGQGLVSVIGQFTSSAVQYITFPEYLVPMLGQGWANDLVGRGLPDRLPGVEDPSRFAGRGDEPAAPPPSSPDAAPSGAGPGCGLARRRHRGRTCRLRRLAARLPPGPTARCRRDPEPVRPDPLSGEFDAADPLHGDRGYAELARRHSAACTSTPTPRRLAIYNKVARATFATTATGWSPAAR